MATLNHEIEDLLSHTSALSRSDSSPLLVAPPANPVILPSLSLVGKIFSHQPIAKTIIKNNLLLAWKFLKSLVTEDREDNLMIFTFEDLEDLTKVLDNSPWNIKGSPLFLQKWNLEDAIEDIDFSKGAFWVQVHGLPLDMMTTVNANSIGASLGEMQEVDNADQLKPSRKSFLRIRVLINLLNPLNPGFTYHRPPKPSLWVQYKYERLSDYCYSCGRIGHLSFVCPVVPKPPDHGRYGEKLKAGSPFSSRVEHLIPLKRPVVPLVAGSDRSSSSVITKPNSAHTNSGLTNSDCPLPNSLCLTPHPIQPTLFPLSPDNPATALIVKPSFVKNATGFIISSLMHAETLSSSGPTSSPKKSDTPHSLATCSSSGTTDSVVSLVPPTSTCPPINLSILPYRPFPIPLYPKTSPASSKKTVPPVFEVSSPQKDQA
ncbi:hypothetical protein SLA2020_366350 [Shorea laevis]